MFKPLFALWIFLASLSLAAPPASAQSSIIPVSAAIHQIRYQVQQQHLSVLSSQPLQPNISYLSDTSPQRIVVDLPDAVFPAVHQEIVPTNSAIDRIRVSQFENSPPKVRMVLDLRSPLDINIRSQRKGKYYETRIEPVLPTRVQAKKPDTSKGSGGNLLTIEKKGQNLELRGDTALYPEIRRNKNNPRQYTLTLYDFETRLKGMMSGLSSPLLEYVSVSNTAKGVDIQLQLSSNNVEIIPFSEGNRCTLQFLVKATDKNLVQLENLEIDELDRRTTRLKLYGSKTFDYQVYPLENPHRLVIDTLGTELENQALAKVLSNSQNIRNIRFIPTQLKEGTDIRMVLDLHDQVKYEYAWRNNYLEILLQGPEQERAPLVTPGNRRAFIVIDAGHGGNDPGAIGPESKTQEKEVTLAVARYLERYLMNDRIQVAMTRSEDLEILLQPRVDVANLRNADLFISIHANSMPPGNTHVRGIETYYTTAQSKGLADTIHKYMIKELGAPDRRVRSRGLFVTRRSKMPSVLLEIGFLSSPAEEALLSNPNYQRKVAKAIRDGIQAYLSENPGIQNKY